MADLEVISSGNCCATNNFFLLAHSVTGVDMPSMRLLSMVRISSINAMGVGILLGLASCLLGSYLECDFGSIRNILCMEENLTMNAQVNVNVPHHVVGEIVVTA